MVDGLGVEGNGGLEFKIDVVAVGDLAFVVVVVVVVVGGSAGSVGVMGVCIGHWTCHKQVFGYCLLKF